jgi:hypothetical protein
MRGPNISTRKALYLPRETYIDCIKKVYLLDMGDIPFICISYEALLPKAILLTATSYIDCRILDIK